jgi:hypothetical protein
MFASLLLLAQAVAEPMEGGDDGGGTAPGAGAERDMNFMVGFRSKYMAVPDSILDLATFPHSGEAIARPSVSGYSLGLEFVVEGNRTATTRPNGIFYVEYIGAVMEDGYWDDRENPADYDDGSWIAPKDLGMVAIGADYMSEFMITDWFAFMVGAGLGIGFVTGELTEWEPGEPDSTGDNTDWTCGSDAPAYDRADDDKLDCPDDGTVAIPPVLPVVDILVAVRFNIKDRASIRLEGGFHDMFFGGLSIGITF